MDRINELTINWNRCIYIDGEINDEMVSRLTPKILILRQESSKPITVAINSNGGSLSSTETLIGLLTGPNQDNVQCQIITVSTNKAYSAAANLLAYGNYAVALEHSEILFHDVRYGGMRDVTPDKALNAAKLLRNENEGFSLRLANHVFRRLMWNYVDLRAKFNDIEAKYPVKATKYKQYLNHCDVKILPTVIFDPALYAVTLCEYLSPANAQLIDNALKNLAHWGLVMKVSNNTQMYATDANSPGLLDGALNLYKTIPSDGIEVPNFGSKKNEADIGLFLTLILVRLNENESLGLEPVLEQALREFRLVDTLNDPGHKITARKLMKLHHPVFFNRDAVERLKVANADEQDQIFEDAAPVVSFMWQFCILLCRELFNGEHTLTPLEGLILGLVDEVPGITFLGSLRKFRIDQKHRDESNGTEQTAALKS